MRLNRPLPAWLSFAIFVDWSASPVAVHSHALGDCFLQRFFYRVLEISSIEILPTSYADYRNFAKDVVKADKAQVVLVKKDGE